MCNTECVAQNALYKMCNTKCVIPNNRAQHRRTGRKKPHLFTGVFCGWETKKSECQRTLSKNYSIVKHFVLGCDLALS